MMVKKSSFYTDNQGRLRYIGRRKKVQSASNVPLTAPRRGEKLQFITNQEGKVIPIGGPSSGGGSSSASSLPKVYAKDFMGASQLPIQVASNNDISDIQTGLSNAIKSTDVNLSDTLLIPAKESVTGGNLLGLSSRGAYGESRGKEIIAINVGAIDNAIKRDGLPSLARWNGLPDTINRSEFIQHVAAHEAGHKWYKTHKSVILAWEKLTKAQGYISEMAKYYTSASESFANAFALYVNGQPLNDNIETFLYEALK